MMRLKVGLSENLFMQMGLCQYQYCEVIIM